MMTYCTDLQLGGSLQREICVTIVKAFLNTTVKRTRMEFYAIRPTIMAEFKCYNGRTQDKIFHLQTQEGLYTFKKLLDQGCASYQSLLDQKLWRPNVGVRDRMAAPESLAAEVNAMVQDRKSVV